MEGVAPAPLPGHPGRRPTPVGLGTFTRPKPNSAKQSTRLGISRIGGPTSRPSKNGSHGNDDGMGNGEQIRNKEFDGPKGLLRGGRFRVLRAVLLRQRQGV